MRKFELAEFLRQLDTVLAESPSLHADADSEVAATWSSQLDSAKLRPRPIRDMSPAG